MTTEAKAPTPLEKAKHYVTHLRDLQRDLVDASQRLLDRERALAEGAAELRVDESIDGRNAEVREAQFVRLCSADPVYQNILAETDDARAEVGLLRADIESIRLEISFLRRELDLQLTDTGPVEPG